MATIVNNPAPTNSGDSGGNGMGFLLGVIILILFVLGLLYVGLPYLRSGFGSPQVNVPDHVNVNVQGGGSGGSK
jgi:hypothetical protein